MSQTKVQLVDFGSAVAASTPTNGPFISAANTVSISTNSTERFKISSTGEATVLGGNLTLNAQGDLRLADADSSNFIALQAPATISSNVTLTLPSADGTNGQALTTNGSGTLSFTTISTTSDKITEGNTEAEVVDTGSNGHFKVTTEGTERFRCDSSGRLLVGTATARSNFNNTADTTRLQVEGTDAATSSLSLVCNNGGGVPVASLHLAKNAGGSIGSNSAVANNWDLGDIRFSGNDGTEFVEAASIACEVDGTPGANDMPGRLVFSTTADSASSPTERVRITSDGKFLAGTTIQTNTAQNVFVSNVNNNNTFRVLQNGGAFTNDIVYLVQENTGGAGFNFLKCFSSVDRLIIGGTGNVTNSNNSYGGISDIKLKENIVDADSQWGDLKALQVRKYNFKEDTGQQTHTQIGLIAQEVELVSPGLVTESPDRDAEGNDLGTVTKSVNYSVLYMKAVKALQEAMERIETLEAKVAALESA